MATYWENSCSFGLRYVSWYKCLIVSLVFSHLGFWSGNLFLIAPFPDLCLLVPFSNTCWISWCPIKWRQRPNMTIAVDWDVKLLFNELAHYVINKYFRFRDFAIVPCNTNGKVA